MRHLSAVFGRHLFRSLVTLTKLPRPSLEQQRVLDAVTDGRNVIISAVAGSGKTSTILQVAKGNPQKSILAIVYNRRLKFETIERAKQEGLSNIVIDTYHGYGYSRYSKECFTDQGLKRVVEKDVQVKEKSDFDIICLDEQQDMTPIMYNFVRRKIITDNISKHPQYVIVGDVRQEIYAFNHADYRFLSRADKAFPSSRPWTKLEHTVSYRLTPSIARFLNTCVSEHAPLSTIRPDGPKPRYLVCNNEEDPYDEFLYYYDKLKVRVEDIVILAPSLRIPAVQKLANTISKLHPELSLYVAMSEDDSVSSVLSTKKLVFATYHQTKGIERKACIAFSFDASYFRYFARHSLPEQCTNAVWVGLTRATTHLSLLHHHEQPSLPFLDMDKVRETCTYLPLRELQAQITEGASEEEKEVSTGASIESANNRGLTYSGRKRQDENRSVAWKVTLLTRNLNESTISHAISLLRLQIISIGTSRARPYLPSEVEGLNGSVEGVANINGTAMPAIYQFRGSGRCSLYQSVMKDCNKRNSIVPNEMRAAVALMDGRRLTTSDIMLLANIDSAAQSGYIFKLTQLQDHSWLNKIRLGGVMRQMQPHVNPRGWFERSSAANIDEKVVRGRIDVTDGDTLWELKNTQALEPVHALQLAVYAAIVKPAPSKFRLLHIPTSTVVDVAGDFKGVTRYLMDIKERDDERMSDEDFNDSLDRGFFDVGPCVVPEWLHHTAFSPKLSRQASQTNHPT